MEKKDVLNLLLKEEREPMSRSGGLFQMWGPKCEKVRKPWILEFEHARASRRVQRARRIVIKV